MGPQDDSSSASSEFFSPISLAFFTRKCEKKGETLEERGFPSLHNSSWIGARLSPIGSFSSEEDEERQESNKENRNNFANEQTRLLVGSITTTAATMNTTVNHRSHNIHSVPLTRNQGSHGGNSQFAESTKTAVSTKLHPLWNSPPSNNDTANANNRNGPRGRAAGLAATVRQRFRPYCTSGMFLSLFSGLHLCAMGAYDFWGWYYRQQDRETAWMLPFGIPPQSTLLAFGAVSPNNDYYYYGSSTAPFYVYYFYRYMGIVTSMVVCTSVAEWLLVASAWRLLHISSRIQKQYPTWHEFGAMFLASALTGQLWMFAFDSTNNLVVGTVAMGT